MPEKYRDLFTAGSRKGSVVLESVNGSNVDRPWFDAIYAVLVSMALPMILAGNI